MTSPTGPLVELAQAYGVMTEYADWRGRPVQVTAETIEAVLAVMGVDTAFIIFTRAVLFFENSIEAGVEIDH